MTANRDVWRNYLFDVMNLKRGCKLQQIRVALNIDTSDKLEDDNYG